MMREAAHTGRTVASAASMVCRIQPSRKRAKTAAAAIRTRPVRIRANMVAVWTFANSISPRTIEENWLVISAMSLPTDGLRRACGPVWGCAPCPARGPGSGAAWGPGPCWAGPACAGGA